MSGFQLDRRGVGEVAKSDTIRRLVVRAGMKVAGAAEATTDLPVRVRVRTTDRAVMDVTLADVSGAASQAKHGTLTRAASSAGLEIGRRGR